jgi:hypothetical protein
MLLNLQNSFEVWECIHFSLLNFTVIPSFLLVNTFPGFSQNSIEKWQVAACRFSKELCENPRNTSIYKIEGNCTLLHSKEFCQFKSMWCLAAKNILIQNKPKGRVKKY